MNLKVFVVLCSATFLVLCVHESLGQDDQDDNVSTETVKISADEIVHDEGGHDDITVEPDVEQIDHEHNEASGETVNVDTDAVKTKSPRKSTGRSGNYQYDEFLGNLDYLGPNNYDFNVGYDAGES